MNNKPTITDDAQQIIDTYGDHAIDGELLYEWANEFDVDYYDLQNEVGRLLNEKKKNEQTV